ncbi:MAG: hypothetical protein H6651_13245 [Ardenticatenales bacterium]|nr:hypothetical protein [Ardenticatenales bacterium]
MGTFVYAPPLGAPAGLVAAAAHTYAPYIQFVDPHARGDLAEVLALALSVLAGDRSCVVVVGFPGERRYHCSRRRLSPATTSWPLVFFALLAWLLAICFRLVRGSATLAVRCVGWAWAAFFWLPVALEQNEINLSTLLGSGEQDNFDFRNHFLGWRELLAPSARLDWGASEPEFLFNLGIMQWGLAIVAIVGLLAGKERTGRQLGYFALAAVGLIFMMLPLSEPLWSAIPFVEYLQFPWRLLGPVAFMLAVLAAAATRLLQDWLLWRPLPGLLLALFSFSPGR